MRAKLAGLVRDRQPRLRLGLASAGAVSALSQRQAQQLGPFAIATSLRRRAARPSARAPLAPLVFRRRNHAAQSRQAGADRAPDPSDGTLSIASHPAASSYVLGLQGFRPVPPPTRWRLRLWPRCAAFGGIPVGFVDSALREHRSCQQRAASPASAADTEASIPSWRSWKVRLGRNLVADPSIR